MAADELNVLELLPPLGVITERLARVEAEGTLLRKLLPLAERAEEERQKRQRDDEPSRRTAG
jgi:hypothetical protein